MTRFIESLDRTQTSLLPAYVDDYVSEESPVRAIDTFIDMLDLAALGFDVESNATGRPAYHPATMLKLYHTATSTKCSRGVSSSESAAAIWN